MPTYEYKCDACSAEFEREQRITEDPDTICVSCGAGAARRLISGKTGVVLKGSGWAVDGYATGRSNE